MPRRMFGDGDHAAGREALRHRKPEPRDRRRVLAETPVADYAVLPRHGEVQHRAATMSKPAARHSAPMAAPCSQAARKPGSSWRL